MAYAKQKYGQMNCHYCNEKLTVWFDDLPGRSLELIVPPHWKDRVVYTLRRTDSVAAHNLIDALDVIQ